LQYWYLNSKAGVIKHPKLRAESKANYRFELLRDGYADCTGVTLKEVGEIVGVRCAFVTGGRQDSVSVTRRMYVGGEGGGRFVVRGAEHAWDWQFPELFARGIVGWAKGGNMPGEFGELVRGSADNNECGCAVGYIYLLRDLL
jgi:hypothetical protein